MSTRDDIVSHAEDRGWNASQLARHAGMSPHTAKRVLTGGPVAAHTIERAAVRLGLVAVAVAQEDDGWDASVRPCELTDVVRCCGRSRKVALGECIERWGADPRNLRIRGSERTMCSGCPDGRERRAAYSERRAVRGA